MNAIDKCFLPARGRFKSCEDDITDSEPDDVQDAFDASRNLANSVTVEAREFPLPPFLAIWIKSRYTTPNFPLKKSLHDSKRLIQQHKRF
ncbi:hypothetical protein PQR75_22060 [Paraburkholderia fungorum]|uniref:hypothetical protein n=1 Tax=Paraburkholderia fungorum TaxID=134537 RepID=UPI0038BA0C33